MTITPRWRCCSRTISKRASRPTWKSALRDSPGSNRGAGERSFSDAREQALFIQRMLELAVRMANREYRAMRFVNDAFRDAAHQNVRQAGTSVRTHHDQVGAFALRAVDDFEEGRANAHE